MMDLPERKPLDGPRTGLRDEADELPGGLTPVIANPFSGTISAFTKGASASGHPPAGPVTGVLPLSPVNGSSIIATKTDSAPSSSSVNDTSLLYTNTFTNSFPDPVILLNKQYCITSWNAHCEQLLGKPALAVLDKPYFSVFPEAANNPMFAHSFRQALQGQKTLVTAADAGVQEGQFDYHCSPLKNEAGQIIGIMLVYHPAVQQPPTATHRSQVDRAAGPGNHHDFSQISDMVQAACSAIGNNLYDPLNRIYSFADLMLTGEEHNLTDSGRQYFSRIKTLVSKSRTLAAGLVHYLSLEEAAVEQTRVNLNGLMQFVKSNLKETLQQAGATLLWGDLPELSANRALLYELLAELIGNALSCRRPQVPLVITVTGGTGAIDFLSEDAPNVGTYYWIKVADNGCGFDAAHRDRLFDLFYHVPQDGVATGNGIGLAICKRIAQKHHGTIHASSNPGEGSVFTICIPLPPFMIS